MSRGCVIGMAGFVVALAAPSIAEDRGPSYGLYTPPRTIYGLTGLVRVPSADRAQDGLLHLGLHTAENPVIRDLGGTTTYSVALGFLPRFELSLGLGSNRAAYDLTAHFRTLVRTGYRDRVGIAVGACDLKRTLRASPTAFVVATYPDDDSPLAATFGAAAGGTSSALAGLRWRPYPFLSLAADHAGAHTSLALCARLAERWDLGIAHLLNGTVATLGYSAPSALDQTRVVTSAPAPYVSSSGPEAAIAKALVRDGFEDVAVGHEPGPRGRRLVAELQDRVHTVRPADGIELALRTMAALAPPETHEFTVRLIHRGTTFVEVGAPAEGWRSPSGPRTVTSIRVLPGRPRGRPAPHAPVANRSAGRADLILGPGVRTNLGTDYGMAQMGLSARPEVWAHLGSGLIATGRWSYPLLGELVRDDPRRLLLDRAAVGYLFSPGPGTLGQVWLGRWPRSRRGVLAEAARPVGRRGLLYAVAAAIDDRDLGARAYGMVQYRHVLPELRASVDLLAGRFAQRDTGAGFGVNRYFGDVMVGLAARATTHARLAELRVTVPLCPRRLPRPNGALRSRSPDSYDHRQRSLVHGANYLTTADAAGQEIALGASLLDTVFSQGRLTAAWLLRDLVGPRPEGPQERDNER